MHAYCDHAYCGTKRFLSTTCVTIFSPDTTTKLRTFKTLFQQNSCAERNVHGRFLKRTSDLPPSFLLYILLKISLLQNRLEMSAPRCSSTTTTSASFGPISGRRFAGLDTFSRWRSTTFTSDACDSFSTSRTTTTTRWSGLSRCWSSWGRRSVSCHYTDGALRRAVKLCSGDPVTLLKYCVLAVIWYENNVRFVWFIAKECLHSPEQTTRVWTWKISCL